jgi:hypothetical protein
MALRVPVIEKTGASSVATDFSFGRLGGGNETTCRPQRTVSREAEELTRRLTAARARVREAQRESKAAATAARKARRGPRR